jgi:hypothetical protein
VVKCVLWCPTDLGLHRAWNTPYGTGHNPVSFFTGSNGFKDIELSLDALLLLPLHDPLKWMRLPRKT